MEGSKRTRHPRRVVIIIAAVLVIAGAGTYLFVAYEFPSYKCTFVPGNNLYLQVVSSTSAEPLAGLPVKGQLVELCPVASSGSAPSRPTHTVVGTYDFTTNSTGYVSIPSSELAGWSYTFDVAYGGHTYQFGAQICGGGATMVELGLPSGSVQGTTSGGGTTVQVDKNGTQTVQNCGVGAWSGNATISQ
jgi:hypothetical protein